MLICDSCFNPTKSRRIDRNPLTGEERGRLCNRCYRIVSWAEETAKTSEYTAKELLIRMYEYSTQTGAFAPK